MRYWDSKLKKPEKCDFYGIFITKVVIKYTITYWNVVKDAWGQIS